MDMKGSIAAIKGAIGKSAVERTSKEVISAAYAVMHLIGGLLLASARLLGSAGPFGMAAVAASGAGLSGVGCLIGAAIGYIISSGLAGSIRYLAAIVLAYTISFAFQDTRFAKKSVFAPSIAAIAALSTGILSSFTSVFTQAPAAAVVLVETVFSFGGCWFFREALSDAERTTEAEELRYTGSVLITAAVLLMAVSQIELFGAISLGRLLALLIVMTCTLRCGIMTGCTIGTAFGIAMDLTAGGLPFYTMAYAFAGLLSGVFNRHGRLLFILAFIIANAAAVACAWSFQAEINSLFEVFAASVIFLLLPSGFLNRAGSMVQPVMGGSGESGLRRYVARRVMGLSKAYGNLYEIVRRNVDEQYNDSDPAKVFDRAADSVCLKCKEKNRCWNRDYIDTLSALNDAIPKMLSRGTLEKGDIPRRFTEKCKTPDAFVTAVNAELRAAAYRRQFSESLRESRNTAWGQYSDMAEILGSVSKELAGTNGADHLAERRLIRYLLSLDIDADAAVYRDARGRLRAVIESGALSLLIKQDGYLDKLSGILGVRLCRLKSQNESEAKLVLMEAEPLAVSVGIAALKKKGEKVSGDKGTYFKTDEGVLCVILSDGMGSGEAAASESREVIDILEGFLRAGVDPAVAMKTLNSVMLLKCGDNWGFATVDLMCVDLFSGETCFYKYGAAPSYVSGSRGIRRIKCENFAPGLSGVAGAAPDIVRMRLKPGSTAIIASDGVVGDSDDAWLRNMLLSCGNDMKTLARDTLKAAERNCSYSDDMTVLAVRVEERA